MIEALSMKYLNLIKVRYYSGILIFFVVFQKEVSGIVGCSFKNVTCFQWRGEFCLNLFFCVNNLYQSEKYWYPFFLRLTRSLTKTLHKFKILCIHIRKIIISLIPMKSIQPIFEGKELTFRSFCSIKLAFRTKSMKIYLYCLNPILCIGLGFEFVYPEDW